MIQVILDTNILERSPNRSSPEFHALQKLCADGKIQIHLSEIVDKEFLRHRPEEIEQNIRPIAKGVRHLTNLKRLLNRSPS
jgi:hypothetical protein